MTLWKTCPATILLLAGSLSSPAGAAAEAAAEVVPEAAAETGVAAETGRPLVVFDIDGTLTPHNLFVYEARAGAAQAVAAYAARGYQVIYLTTRIPLFQSGLPAWLSRNGFPDAPLHIAQTPEQRRDPASFKAGVLQAYAQAGWRLAWAYGDSSTDFAAYARAGIPQERVFALRRRFASTCAEGLYRACLDGWQAHLRQLPGDFGGNQRGVERR